MGEEANARAAKIIAVCERDWNAHKSDCSGFVKAVAKDLGIVVIGQANGIIDSLGTNWMKVPNGSMAASFAAQGHFVIAGLKANPNGHVVVVVKGPLNRGLYPTAYWGTLHGVGKKDTTINWAWTKHDLAKVGYFMYPANIAVT